MLIIFIQTPAMTGITIKNCFPAMYRPYAVQLAKIAVFIDMYASGKSDVFLMHID